MMTAPFGVSRREVGVAHPLLSALQPDTLRTLLLAERGERIHQLEKEATRLAALTTNPSKDPTGFDRAMSALHMYGARAAIEEIDDALVRINVGGYGTCQGCDRPIPCERLEAIPQARFCAACLAPATSCADRRGASRRGAGRGEHTGAPPAPVGSPQHLRDEASNRSENKRGVGAPPRDPLALAESRARHPSSVSDAE
jgi:DnaK suppressor protein